MTNESNKNDYELPLRKNPGELFEENRHQKNDSTWTGMKSLSVSFFIINEYTPALDTRQKVKEKGVDLTREWGRYNVKINKSNVE